MRLVAHLKCFVSVLVISYWLLDFDDRSGRQVWFFTLQQSLFFRPNTLDIVAQIQGRLDFNIQITSHCSEQRLQCTDLMIVSFLIHRAQYTLTVWGILITVLSDVICQKMWSLFVAFNWPIPPLLAVWRKCVKVFVDWAIEHLAYWPLKFAWRFAIWWSSKTVTKYLVLI